MVSPAVQDALNAQMRREFYASYLYLSMAAHCERQNLPGVARWLRLQSQEEYGHAMRIYQHLVDRGGEVVLGALDQPPGRFASLLELFTQAHEHERAVTEQIHALYEVAVRERDYAAQVMLQWFITEQVEEEKLTAEVLEQVRRAGEEGPALLLLDERLGARTSAE